MHQTAFINVTALVAAYIVNPQLKVYYTQDDDIYLGHSVDDLLKGLYGSNYPEIIKAEMVRRKGHDVKKSTIPEELSKQYKCSHIVGVLEERFRSQFRYHNPANEPEVQKRLQEFLDALGYRSGEDYDREMGAFKFSGREYIPDFVFWKLNAVLEVKFVDSKAKKSKIITEMSDDCSAYPKVYDYIIFLVYDLGYISDVEEFKRDFESKGYVRVIVIKH